MQEPLAGAGGDKKSDWGQVLQMAQSSKTSYVLQTSTGVCCSTVVGLQICCSQINVVLKHVFAQTLHTNTHQYLFVKHRMFCLIVAPTDIQQTICMYMFMHKQIDRIISQPKTNINILVMFLYTCTYVLCLFKILCILF